MVRSVYRQSPVGPVDPSFRALSGRLKFTVRRHKFHKDSLSIPTGACRWGTLEEEQLLHRNVQRFRGGLVFKAHRLLYHSTLGSRVIKKKKKNHLQRAVGDLDVAEAWYPSHSVEPTNPESINLSNEEPRLIEAALQGLKYEPASEPLHISVKWLYHLERAIGDLRVAEAPETFYLRLIDFSMRLKNLLITRPALFKAHRLFTIWSEPSEISTSQRLIVFYSLL